MGDAVKVEILGSLFFAGKHVSEPGFIAEVYRSIGLNYLLERIEGDFALFILDGRKQQLHLVTDPFSSKVIYVLWDEMDEVFRCGTSIKAITDSHRTSLKMNWEPLLFKGRKKHSSQFSTAVTGVQRMRGGHAGTVDFHEKTWRSSPYRPAGSASAGSFDSYTSQDFISAYRDSIEQAVSKRLAGRSEALVTLSGGFDSSIVYALASKMVKTKAATICTETSLYNQEIDRARELTLGGGSDHLIFPVGFHDQPPLHDWVQLVHAKESIGCGFEDLVKSQLLQRAKQAFGPSSIVLSGMGSDQFNGGTTTLDYSGKQENDSWEVFMSKMLRSKWEDYRASEFTGFFQFAYHFSSIDFRESLWPFDQDIWNDYMEGNGRSLQSSGVFLESKLSSAHGMDIGFPFLDSAAINILRAIPEELRPELLFDKQILRKAFADLLPDSFKGKPKFYRTPRAKEKIYSYLKNVIYGENYALLKRAFDSSKGLQQRFSIDKVISFLEDAKEHPHFQTHPYILELINIGLLEAHFFEDAAPIAIAELEGSVVYPAESQEFDREALSVRVLRSDDHKKWQLPITIDAKVQIFKGAEASSAPAVLKLNQEQYLDVTQPEVLLIIEAMDQRRNLLQLCGDLKIEVGAVKDAFEDLLAKGVIRFLDQQH